MRQAIVIFLIFAIPKMKGSWMTEYCEDKRKTSMISNFRSIYNVIYKISYLIWPINIVIRSRDEKVRNFKPSSAYA